MNWTVCDWPFFEPHHREIALRAANWRSPVDDADIDEAALPHACRVIAKSLSREGLLQLAVPNEDSKIDIRSVCLVREALAYNSALADVVFAMQGIGTASIALFGTAAQKARYLPDARDGNTIAAFALTEPGSGSDVANMITRAIPEGESFIINGEKVYISNAPFADHYVVLARTDDIGARGLSTFIVDARTSGLITSEATKLIAVHPIGGLSFKDCKVARSSMLGELGKGFSIAMATFDIFRTSVGAAAIGMARRAFDETKERVQTRHLFNGKMADIPGVQTSIAEMAIDIDLGALAVYRAAWSKDTMDGRFTREASMAKLCGTEAGSRVIDRAVQLFGALGITNGCIVERLYREVRAMRIYEGASEVQKIVIGRSELQVR